MFRRSFLIFISKLRPKAYKFYSTLSIRCVQISLNGLDAPRPRCNIRGMYDLESAKLKKHSVTIAGHRTSISLEHGFWQELRAIAEAKGLSINELVRQLDEARAGSLSGAIRVYVLEEIRKRQG